MNMTKRSGKKPWRQALEDAIVVAGFTGLGAMIAHGFPPDLELAYGVLTASALAGLIAYGKARRIEPV